MEVKALDERLFSQSCSLTLTAVFKVLSCFRLNMEQLRSSFATS